MKKIFTTIFMASMLLSAQAGLGLSYITLDENEEEVIHTITQDTTIEVSDYEEDFFGDGMVMSFSGYVYTTSKNLTVTIERTTLNTRDEFCLNGCFAGNGEENQVLELTISKEEESFITHFYPTEASTTLIKYTFNDGINPAIAITVKYCYLTSAVDHIVAPQYNGIIYNLLGQPMPTTNISELPAGIYVIGNKKFIKQ